MCHLKKYKYSYYKPQIHETCIHYGDNVFIGCDGLPKCGCSLWGDPCLEDNAEDCPLFERKERRDC